MGAVGDAEGVVHVEVGQGGELAGERGVVCLFPRVEAQVLQQQHLALAERGDGGLDLRADAVGCGGDGCVLQLRQSAGDGREPERFYDLPLGPPQVGAEDHLRPLLAQVLDGGQRGPDAQVV